MNVTISGEYILRISICESGLNATYFNTTDLGYLVDLDFNEESFIRSKEGAPVNLGSTISWTGDLGGRSGIKGDIGAGSYFERFMTRTESQIDFDWSRQDFEWVNLTWQNITFDDVELKQENSGPFPRAAKFRDQYWSALWTGLITPTVAETYNFSAVVDSYSSIELRIGGRGLMTNMSDSGELVFSYNGSTGGSLSGVFTFTDTLPREFKLVYKHYLQGPSYSTLFWESPSTTYQVIPPTAFSHYVNVTHRNATVHPATLSPSHSTVYGHAVSKATAGVWQSFLVYGRDAFGNLLQKGNDWPTLLAVDGYTRKHFRGHLTDFGNSTYQLSYYPKLAGEYILYITIGCCPPHPSVGLSSEIQNIRSLLVTNAPFRLTVSPGATVSERSFAAGAGASGGIAGETLRYTVFYRDSLDNPTTAENSTGLVNAISIQFKSMRSESLLTPTFLEIDRFSQQDRALISYSIQTSGEYIMAITLNNVNTLGSPHLIRIFPATVAASKTVTEGDGRYHATAGKIAWFTIKLKDVFGNAIRNGGFKFYSRLRHRPTSPSPTVFLGNHSGQVEGSSGVAVVCIDLLNGEFRCGYTNPLPGLAEIKTFLLKNKDGVPDASTSAGGRGLQASWYSTKESGNGDGLQRLIIHGTPVNLKIPAFSVLALDIDRQPAGATSSEDTNLISAITGPSSIRDQDMCVEWFGYLVSPFNDTFRFTLDSNHFHGTVYIDGILVFDDMGISVERDMELEDFPTQEVERKMRRNRDERMRGPLGVREGRDGANLTVAIVRPMPLQYNAAYEIRVKASLAHYPTLGEISYVDLMWSTSRMDLSPVSPFFLYAAAEEIHMSPFPVTIVSP